MMPTPLPKPCFLAWNAFARIPRHWESIDIWCHSRPPRWASPPVHNCNCAHLHWCSSRGSRIEPPPPSVPVSDPYHLQASPATRHIEWCKSTRQKPQIIEKNPGKKMCFVDFFRSNLKLERHALLRTVRDLRTWTWSCLKHGNFYNRARALWPWQFRRLDLGDSYNEPEVITLNLNLKTNKSRLHRCEKRRLSPRSDLKKDVQNENRPWRRKSDSGLTRERRFVY